MSVFELSSFETVVCWHIDGMSADISAWFNYDDEFYYVVKFIIICLFRYSKSTK